MDRGLFFIDAPWSGDSRIALEKVSKTLAELDDARRLELLIVGIDHSNGLDQIANVLGHQIGGYGETAWVLHGEIIGSSIRGRDTEMHTRRLLTEWKTDAFPEVWPTAVLDLATALYRGDDCRFPLSDLLEESGYRDLAYHFRKVTTHPPACSSLYRILGET